jgi:hypothetical protein
MDIERDRTTGKYVTKGEDKRLVKSIRATESTWEWLGTQAEALGVVRADLLEMWAKGEGLPSNASDLPSEGATTNNPITTDKGEGIDPVKVLEAIQILTKALSLPPNKGGAIKTEIKKALEILEGE